MTRNLLLLLFMVPLVLSTCSTVIPINPEWEDRQQILNALDEWDFSGKLNIRTPDESRSPRIQWQQRHLDYTITTWGTVGIGMSTITGSPEKVTVQQRGKAPISASTPEELILQQLGYELPVSQSIFWLRGLPAPNSEPILTFDEVNQLSSFEQSGWRIAYRDYRAYETVVLPSRITIENDDGFRLTFYRLRWNLDI